MSPEPHAPSPSPRVARAVTLFDNGCACSQAVLCAFCSQLGLPEATGMRLAAPFAGGTRTGEICGAVSGALMVLGLVYASDACGTADGRRTAYAYTLEFQERFSARNGATTCRELLGFDMRDSASIDPDEKRRRHRTVCPMAVQTAAEILEELLQPGMALR